MYSFSIIPNIRRFSETTELIRKYPLAFEYDDFFLPSVLDDKSELDRIIDFYKAIPRCRSADTLHGAFLDVTVHSDDPLIREVSEKRVLQSMEVASRLGVKGVVFHTNRLNGFLNNGYLNNWVEKNEIFFKNVCDKYPDITVLMENMFDESPEPLAQLADKMADVDNFGVCLDFAHACLTDVSPECWWSILMPYVKHIHINDNDLKLDRHWALGKGQIDWNLISGLLSKAKTDISILIEVSSPEIQKESIDYILSHPTLSGLFPCNQSVIKKTTHL